MTPAEILAKFEGVRATRSQGSFLARCPAHDDRSPSLSIRFVEDGRVLLYCFSGCEFSEVLAAAGLKPSDVMPERKGEFSRELWPFDPRDILEALIHEMTCAVLICENVAEGAIVSQELRDRLMLAATRIRNAANFCGPRRTPPELKRLRKGDYQP